VNYNLGKTFLVLGLSWFIQSNLLAETGHEVDTAIGTPGIVGVETVVPEKSVKELLLMRDPFKRPEETPQEKEEARSELEKFSVESVRLVAVLSGMSRLRAMIATPDGKTYFIAEKAKIGMRGGSVIKINPNSVLVREKIANIVGQEETVETLLKLPDEKVVHETKTLERLVSSENAPAVVPTQVQPVGGGIGGNP